MSPPSARISIVALGAITQNQAGDFVYPRYGGVLKDSFVEIFPNEYLEHQKVHPAKFNGDIYWAYKGIVVQVLNPHDAQSDYEISAKVAHFVVNYLIDNDAHKLLDEFIPFEKYKRRVDAFFALPEEVKWEDGIPLAGLSVLVKTIDEEKHVLARKEGILKGWYANAAANITYPSEDFEQRHKELRDVLANFAKGAHAGATLADQEMLANDHS